jgi:thiol-disulfide isomerase/thioredoxin
MKRDDNTQISVPWICLPRCRLFLTLIICFSLAGAKGHAELKTLPSFGSGKVEIILFADYFCPPCQTVEEQTEHIFKDLPSKAGARVYFVDVPNHWQSPLYAKYFLYALNARNNYQQALQVRKVLFALAKNNSGNNEDAVIGELRKNGIAWKPIDLKPVFLGWNEIIKTYKVSSTPVCIVKFSVTDVRRYQGIGDIRKALADLRAGTLHK